MERVTGSTRLSMGALEDPLPVGRGPGLDGESGLEIRHEVAVVVARSLA
jgi:hypothetical protein